MERVVITGIGAISPLGHTVAESWRNACNGISGIGPITLFDASNFLVQAAGEVKDFQPEAYMNPREVRRRDRNEQFATAAARQAIEQSGLKDGATDPERVGVIIASAIGGLNSLEEVILTVNNDGPRRANPFAIPMLMANGSSGLITIDYGFLGPAFSVASACASGADAIGTAWTLIRAGVIDAAVTGGTEATITPVGIAAFDRLGAMSRRKASENTPQPFDLNRDGLVMGEGCAILVLESESHARLRRVEILAELAGYAANSDAFHITAPSETGAGGARAIRQALHSAEVNLNQVDYINAHGTATVLNDLSETLAIKSAFGDFAYNIPVSSTKSMTGHIMGATGALETVFCVQAVREGVIPPTINYQTPDPQCDLDYVPNIAREQPIQVAISNAFGFGGHNTVLVVRKYVR